MENITKVFLYNKGTNVDVKLTRAKIIYSIKGGVIDIVALLEIIRLINSYNNKYMKQKIPIFIDFENKIFFDKLTYVILECLCYDIYVKHKQRIEISYITKNVNIFNKGIRSSPLYLLNPNSKKNDPKSFEKKFLSSNYQFHFRRLIKGNINTNDSKLSELFSSITIFLNFFNLSPTLCHQIAEVLIELVGNAIEHTNSDCIIDIDIADNFKKEGNDDDYFCGINIAIVNFSDQLFGDSIKTKLCSQNLNERYESVKTAYENHSKSFVNEYTEQDFYNIASFQDKISGDMSKIGSGGKGLTTLLRSLIEQSEFYKCYMLSGNNVVNFKKDLLGFDSNGWTGFNVENDFINNIPSSEVISRSKLFFPGTAYNLNFVLMKERDKHE